MQTEIRPKKQKKSAQKLDKPVSSHYKRYRGMFTVIVSTIIVFLVFNPFFQMANPLSAFGVDAVKQIESQETLKALQDANALPTNAYQMKATALEQSVHRKIEEGGVYVGGFENNATSPEGNDLGYSPEAKEPVPTNPTEQKVYDHFWLGNAWTYAKIKKMNAQTMEIEFKKLGILKSDKPTYLIALKFLRRIIMPAKHSQESLAEFESTLTTSTN